MKNIDVEESRARKRNRVIDGANFLFAARTYPPPAPELGFILVLLIFRCCPLLSKHRPSHDGLLEVVGDGIGQIFPQRPADRIGGREKAAGGWVEEAAGVEDGDEMAFFSGEAADGALGELAGVA